MDQNLLALLQVRAVYQDLPSRQSHKRNGRRLFHGEVFGLYRHVSFIHGDEFRKRPDPVLARPRIDVVARFELHDPGSDADHDTSKLISQNERQSIRQYELEFAVSDFGIQGVHASGIDLDQHVMVPKLRIWRIAEP